MSEELKPGQKFPTPTPGFGDRVFYETLLRQRPDSAMAQEWCISYGVLPHGEAKRLFKVVLDRKKSGRGSAISSPSPVKRKPKKAKILNDDAPFDAELVGSGGDGIGTMTL